MLWLLYTTAKCNLKCKYCGGSWPDIIPEKPVYDVEDLREYLEHVDEEPTIVFYGGEPLLNPKFIVEVMDNIDATYGIQTNATLHHLLPPRYWERFYAVLISIDGPEDFNDARRGKGTYKKALELLRKVKDLGVPRPTARMAVDGESDIYRDVMHLLKVGFKYVHWQLSVDWVERWDVVSWAKRSYLPGIKKLAEDFLNHYLESGELLGIVPFLGFLKAHRRGWDWVPCGAGKYAYSIITDGTITACPIAPVEKWAKAGSIYIKEKPKVIPMPDDVPCMKCKYYKYCGGRCLYVLYERFWGREGFEEICWLTKKTIDTFFEVVGDYVEELSAHPEVEAYDPLKDSTEAVP